MVITGQEQSRDGQRDDGQQGGKGDRLCGHTASRPSMLAIGTMATAAGKAAPNMRAILTLIERGSQFTARKVKRGQKTILNRDVITSALL